MMRNHLAFLKVLAAAMAVTTNAAEACLDNASPQATSSLTAQVEAFFRSDDASVRAGHAAAIAESAGGDYEAVVRAIANMRLWDSLPDRGGEFLFSAATDESVKVSYVLPDEYDSLRRHPVIICLPDEFASTQETLALARRLLGQATHEFALICPERPIGGTFHQPPAGAGNLRLLMRETGRLIHTDTDRVYLFGFRKGGEAVWGASFAHADALAGAVIVCARPRVPYPEQIYPLLLENLRHLPVLTVWVADDRPLATAMQKEVAAHNRGIVEFAKDARLPITGISLDNDEPLAMPAGHVSALLERKRAPLGRRVSHSFRYPAQGAAGWLIQTEPAGEVWEADQLSILASPATDRDQFIRDTLEEKLGYLSGLIDGQTITIVTRRSARVDLELPDGLVDWSKPVTVVCNGRKRRERLIRPNINTLLNTAYDRWDFQRLVAARLSMSIRARPPGGK